MAFIPPALWNFPPRVAIGKNLLVVVVLSQLAASPGTGVARPVIPQPVDDTKTIRTRVRSYGNAAIVTTIG